MTTLPTSSTSARRIPRPDVAALRAAVRRIPVPLRIAVEEVFVVAASLGCVLLSHPSTFTWGTPTAIIACLALPLRLRWPWLAMIACLVAVAGGLGLAPAIAALYRIGRCERAPVILAWATAAVLASTVPVLATQNLSWGDATLTVAFSILWMTAPSAGGVLITTRQKLTESLAELRRARQAELEAREEQARAQERTRIGQEIHDAVGHHATLIAVEAAALASTTDTAETRRVALRVRALAKESLSEMRAALGLADEPQEAGTTLADLPALLGRARQAGVDIDFEEPEAPLPTTGLAPVVGRAVFRIVQESLTNATKYAPGSLIRVKLAQDGAQLMVSVISGPPVIPVQSAPESGGMGLAGMAERARTAGGTLHIERGDDGEFTVRARLPLRGQPLRG